MAADAAREATYFVYDLNEMPAKRAKAKSLGALFDGRSERWYVPAGFSLAPFAEWLTRAADAADEPTWFEYDMADLRERQAKIKALGGRFDKERRRWYVPAGLSLAPFQQYLRAPEPTYIELDMSTRPAQRAELKALGAGYDAQRKRWYVPAGRDVAPFRRWLTIVT